MFRFKKIASFLSVLTAFSLLVGTFPAQAFAEVYTGELVLPNTTIATDYGQSFGNGLVEAKQFNNNSTYATPSVTMRADNNFIASLPQKAFSMFIKDGVMNCRVGVNDPSINPGNKSILLAYTEIYDNSDPGNSDNNADPLCQVVATVKPIVANATLTPGGRFGNGYVTQTYDALPFTTLGESAQNTTVESIPNDPDNVKVTISENVTEEVYGMHFGRQGDVERVLEGDYTPYFPDNGLYKDGNTYVINWISNWIGQVLVYRGGEDGSYTIWDGQTGDPLKVNTGYSTPQIVQLASIAPALVSTSIVRARNSDVLYISPPYGCTYWTDGGAWRRVSHMYCRSSALTADGRIGSGIIYNSSASSGWFREFLGVALTFAGLVSGAEFIMAFVDATVFSAAAVMNVVVPGGVQAIVGHEVMNALDAFTTASLAAIAGPTAFGTVEDKLPGPTAAEGVWSWTWSPASAYQETIDPKNVCPDGSARLTDGTCSAFCTNGATNPPTCGCTNGAPFSSYPICLIIGDLCPDGTTRPPTGCPTTDFDLCKNIDGIQLEVPAGYTRDSSGNCNITVVTDLCANMPGMQSVVPAGYTRDASGNCNNDGGTDLCPNIEGKQTTIPDGYTRNSVGLCISNVVWTEYCTGGSDPFGHQWQIWKYDNSDPPNYSYVRSNDPSCAPPTTAVWTNYCTGGSDPFGHSWQIWRYDNSNPVNYEFVGIDLTTCGPLAKIDGSCGASHWNCITGESANNAGGTAGPWTWSCKGSNGGLDVSCSQSTGRGVTGGTGTGSTGTGSTGTGSCVVKGGIALQQCSGSVLIGYNNCGDVVNNSPCSYGCSGGACRPPPPITFTPFTATPHVGTPTTFAATGGLQLRPILVKRGEPTWLYWNIQNALTCSVIGTNGDVWPNDSWPNAFSSGAGGRQTQPIQGHTVFTLRCMPLPGDSSLTDVRETQAVDVAPIFQEV